jgi:hypothetical protein
MEYCCEEWKEFCSKPLTIYDVLISPIKDWLVKWLVYGGVEDEQTDFGVCPFCGTTITDKEMEAQIEDGYQRMMKKLDEPMAIERWIKKKLEETKED